MTDQTEAAPKVPPPAENTRKPTAKEVADRALEGVLGLQAKLDELEARGVVPATTGDSTPAGFAELDRDLSALTDFVNDLAGKVGTTSGSVAVADPRTEETLQAIGADLQGLTERLHRLETGTSSGDSAGPAAEHLTKVAQHLEQELGSLGRAVDTLTRRVAELDSQPQAAEGVDGFTERWNQVARDMETTLAGQRAFVSRALEPLSERLARLETRPPAAPGEPASNGHVVPKVYSAMVDVMREVREVGKNGTGPREAGSYVYRKLDDAVDAVGAALRQVGILLVPVEVISHEIRQTVVPAGEGSRTWTTATVTVRWRYIHPEDGSSQDVVMSGEGRDMGDKATGKANSNAWKNALVQSLNIPVQGMPEVEDEHPVIGAGQGPAEQRPSAPASQQPQPQGGQLTKDEAARRTVQALNNLGSVPPAERRAKVDAIARYAQEQALTDLVVDGSKVSQVIIATLATLPHSQAYASPPQNPVEARALQPHPTGQVAHQAVPPDPQPQQFPLPSAPDEPPWGDNDGGAYYIGDRKADIPVNYP
jgi:hypothetical protein